MHLRDLERVLVEEERRTTRRSEHALHLGKRFRVERVEPVLSRILPVEGRAAHDLCGRALSHFVIRGVLARSSGENRHRHAIEQASRRWRGGRRGDSGRTRRNILISTQLTTASAIVRQGERRRRRVQERRVATEVLRRRVKLCLVRVDADHRRPRPAKLGLGEEGRFAAEGVEDDVARLYLCRLRHDVALEAPKPRAGQVPVHALLQRQELDQDAVFVQRDLNLDGRSFPPRLGRQRFRQAKC